MDLRRNCGNLLLTYLQRPDLGSSVPRAVTQIESVTASTDTRSTRRPTQAGAEARTATRKVVNAHRTAPATARTGLDPVQTKPPRELHDAKTVVTRGKAPEARASDGEQPRSKPIMRGERRRGRSRGKRLSDARRQAGTAKARRQNLLWIAATDPPVARATPATHGQTRPGSRPPWSENSRLCSPKSASST